MVLWVLNYPVPVLFHCRTSGTYKRLSGKDFHLLQKLVNCQICEQIYVKGRRSARLALKSKRTDENDSIANCAVYFHRWTIYLQKSITTRWEATNRTIWTSGRSVAAGKPQRCRYRRRKDRIRNSWPAIDRRCWPTSTRHPSISCRSCPLSELKRRRASSTSATSVAATEIWMRCRTCPDWGRISIQTFSRFQFLLTWNPRVQYIFFLSFVRQANLLDFWPPIGWESNVNQENFSCSGPIYLFSCSAFGTSETASPSKHEEKDKSE